MSKPKPNTNKKTTVKHKNGKGDSPRNIFSKEFEKNYEKINWKKKKS